jgi:hypothetical protein
VSEDRVIEVLGDATCVGLLAAADVGRLCVVDAEGPAAYPVNHRVVTSESGDLMIVLRARADGVLDRPGEPVAFQVDGIDHRDATGWSVLARGTLHHSDDPGLPPWILGWDPHPWAVGRDTWLVLVVTSVSGRRLVASVTEWAFSIRGYL